LHDGNEVILLDGRQSEASKVCCATTLVRNGTNKATLKQLKVFIIDEKLCLEEFEKALVPWSADPDTYLQQGCGWTGLSAYHHAHLVCP
jgi:predicted molibdopterin-dependent oxidoreductase YjgC